MAKDTQVFSSRRLEALTDGVFAIAMTLLVLDLKVGELGQVASNEQLWEALKGMQANLISFVVSFLLLGSMWAVHVRQFEYIKQADRHLTMINTLRLLVVVLIPFTTSLAGAYPDVLLGRVLFPFNFFVLAVVSWWQWSYATREKGDLVTNLTSDEIKRGRVRNVVVVAISFAVVVAALLIGQWAFLLFLLTGPAIMSLTKNVKASKQKTQR